jgi:hypothetical protein
MPMSLTAAELGPENTELTEARKLMLVSEAKSLTSTRTDSGALFTGKVESTPVEIFIDLDGRIRRGKCFCGHYRQFGLRNGPCRHMIALRYLSSSLSRSQSASTVRA